MKTNQDLAIDVQDAIKWETLLIDTMIGVAALNRVVTLKGNVDGNYNRIEPENNDELKKHAMQNPSQPNPATEDQDSQVDGRGNKVTLDGVANSFYQQPEAARIAWNAQGIKEVYNEISTDLTDK